MNRSKSKIPSYHGSKTLTAYRHDMRDPEIDELEPLPKNYERMKKKKDGSWGVAAAEERFESLRSKYDSQTQKAGSSSAGCKPRLEDVQLSQTALGNWSGYIRGVGKMVAGTSSRASKLDEEYIKKMVAEEVGKAVEGMSTKVNMLGEVVAALCERLARYETPPTDPAAPPSTSDEGLRDSSHRSYSSTTDI